jgi:hypothetical protein
VLTIAGKDGQRAIGTKMDNPKVIEAVLQQGKSFQRISRISDTASSGVHGLP